MSYVLNKRIVISILAVLFVACGVLVLGWRLRHQAPHDAFRPLGYTTLALPRETNGLERDLLRFTDPGYFSAWVSQGDGRVAVVTGNVFGSRIYWSKGLPQSSEEYTRLTEIGPKVCVLASFAWNPFHPDQFVYVLRELDAELPPETELSSELKATEKEQGQPAVEAYVKKLLEDRLRNHDFQEVLYTGSLGDATPKRVAVLQGAAKMAPRWFNTANKGPYYHCLCWSSDSTFLVYRNTDAIYKVALDGSEHRRVYSFPQGNRLASTIVSLPDNSFSFVEVGTGSAVNLITIDDQGKTLGTETFPGSRHYTNLSLGTTRWVSFRGFTSGLAMQVVSRQRPSDFVRYSVDPGFSGKSRFAIVGFGPNEESVLLTKKAAAGEGAGSAAPPKNGEDSIEFVMVPVELEKG